MIDMASVSIKMVEAKRNKLLPLKKALRVGKPKFSMKKTD